MKKPGYGFNIFIFLLLLLTSLYFSSLFITFYGFTSLTDPSTGTKYEPFLFDANDVENVPLASLMNSIVSFSLFLQLISIVLCFIWFFSKNIKKKNRACVMTFVFYFFIAFLIELEYAISYKLGLEWTKDSTWIPQSDPNLVDKYILYFTVAQQYQYNNFLDSYTVLIILLILLSLSIISIFTSSSKYNSYIRNNKTQENNPSSSTVVINNPPAINTPIQMPKIITNNHHNSNKGVPQIINNPQPQKPIIINNPPNLNNYINNNEPYNIKYHDSNRPNITIPSVSTIRDPIRVDIRKKNNLKFNNILLNKILSEPPNKLSEAKILIQKIARLSNDDEKKSLLVLVYKSCINNDYLNHELKNAIYEKLGSKLPVEFEHKNAEKSVNFLLIYNKEGFKNLMNSLISII